MKTKNIATIYAVLAAALYAINIPLSKLLLAHAGATMMAAFLYLGAGIGLFLYANIEKITGTGGNIARTNSANVSLLNNFEIVATSLIALLLGESIKYQD